MAQDMRRPSELLVRRAAKRAKWNHRRSQVYLGHVLQTCSHNASCECAFCRCAPKPKGLPRSAMKPTNGKRCNLRRSFEHPSTLHKNAFASKSAERIPPSNEHSVRLAALDGGASTERIKTIVSEDNFHIALGDLSMGLVTPRMHARKEPPRHNKSPEC